MCLKHALYFFPDSQSRARSQTFRMVLNVVPLPHNSFTSTFSLPHSARILSSANSPRPFVMHLNNESGSHVQPGFALHAVSMDASSPLTVHVMELPHVPSIPIEHACALHALLFSSYVVNPVRSTLSQWATVSGKHLPTVLSNVVSYPQN